MNGEEPTIVDLLTEIRDLQRRLVENDVTRLAFTQQQVDLYSRNLAASERRARIGITSSIVFAVAMFLMILGVNPCERTTADPHKP